MAIQNMPVALQKLPTRQSGAILKPLTLQYEPGEHALCTDIPVAGQNVVGAHAAGSGMLEFGQN